MSDLFTLFFFGQTEERFLANIVTMLRLILTSDRGLNPDDVKSAQNILDILEGWLPLDAGEGSIMLEVYGFGRLRIRVWNSYLDIQYKPWRRTTPSMRHKGMFFVHSKVANFGWHFPGFHADLTKLLDIAASLRGADFERRGVVQIKWHAGTQPIPEPGKYWIYLRERARKTGERPPRACHWLPGAQQNKGGQHV